MEWLWAEKASTDFPCVIAAKVGNGLSAIEARQADGSWARGHMNGVLGQQWVLPQGSEKGGRFTVRALDLNGASYGTACVRLPGDTSRVTPAAC